MDIYVDKKDKKMIVVDQDLQNNILNISTRNVCNSVMFQPNGTIFCVAQFSPPR